MWGIELTTWCCQDTTEVFPMLSEEVQPPDAAESEASQPKVPPKEDPDKIRGEVFKRMFPDVSRKPSE
jgi:hypothetical protein